MASDAEERETNCSMTRVDASYLQTIEEVLSSGPSSAVARRSSNLPALLELEVVAKRLRSDSQKFLEEAENARRGLETKLERERYGNATYCHRCKSNCAEGSLPCCFCFDEEKRRGKRLCRTCIEILIADAPAKSEEVGGLKYIDAEHSYAKCQKCGTFKCDDWHCKEVLECMVCRGVFLCSACAEDEDSGLLKCRCEFLCICKQCKDGVMSKEEQEKLESEHADAKCFKVGFKPSIVVTTCRCRECVNIPKKNKEGKRSYMHCGSTSLVKIVPCISCKELIHESSGHDHEGACDILRCSECGEPEDDYTITCLRCKEEEGPDFSWIRHWKGKGQRDFSIHEWKCSSCREADSDFDY